MFMAIRHINWLKGTSFSFHNTVCCFLQEFKLPYFNLLSTGSIWKFLLFKMHTDTKFRIGRCWCCQSLFSTTKLQATATLSGAHKPAALHMLQKGKRLPSIQMTWPSRLQSCDSNPGLPRSKTALQVLLQCLLEIHILLVFFVLFCLFFKALQCFLTISH